MDVETLRSWYEMAWPLASSVLLGIVILVVGWMASKWAQKLTHRAAQRSKLDEALGRFFASIARYTVLAATVIAALGAVGVETTSLLTVFATAGLAIGLALQGSLANFAAGVMILFFRPFDLGDKITAGGHTGVVDDIGLFASTFITPDNETIVIPNGAIIGGSIVNFTRQGTLRGGVGVGVAYGTEVPNAMEVLLRAAKRTDLVLVDPEPHIALEGFGASSVDFTVYAWTKAGDYLAMLHNLRTTIYEELNAAGIEIPFDQVVMHNAPADEAQAAK
ncbi:MAG: mechanosensitive ion channel [Deltaproteobacteria bacterium]|nr:mechanosensitive ion channel [Deltaproteobacteria bacterium]MBW2255105.1 mechanosensitive ion channel [Deltaproteobacteria bacterium]